MINTLSGNWVIDSQLFIYFQDSKSPFHSDTKELFSKIIKQTFTAVVAQQNILEIEAVLIRHYRKNKIEVIAHIEKILNAFRFSVITPQNETYRTYHELLRKIEAPVDIFDVYLAATMLDNNIRSILTFNIKDFAPIPNIRAVNPFK